MPKNKNGIRLTINRELHGMDPKYHVLRPCAGASCNLIYRTYKTSSEAYRG